MKCINDIFQQFLQIRLSDSPYPCPDFMQQPDIRISLCNSSPPSSLYPYVVFYVTGISIFCRDSDTTLFAYSAPPFLHPALSFFQFYSTRMTIFYVSSRLSSKVETRPRCFLLINHFVYVYVYVRTLIHTYLNIYTRTHVCTRPHMHAQAWAVRGILRAFEYFSRERKTLTRAALVRVRALSKTSNGAERAKVDGRNFVESFGTTLV